MEGELYAMEGGCTQCVCEDNRWACENHCENTTVRGCDDSDEFTADNGQSCACNDDGRLECLCPIEGPNREDCICEPSGRWRCSPQMPVDTGCNLDSECMASRCIAALCADRHEQRCFPPEQRMCLRQLDEMCLCTEGMCAFADEPPVRRCMDGPQ